MAFLKAEDIANRGLQYLGALRITTLADLTRQAQEANFCYDKLRAAELRRAVWNFATRRMILRVRTATTKNLTFPTWASATAYVAGDIVADSLGALWIAASGSTGVTPGTTGVSPAWVAYFGGIVADSWSGSVAYLPGDMVIQAGVVYLCILANTNQPPPIATYFHPPQGMGSSATVPFAPAGYDTAGKTPRSLFTLPYNYLRVAPQDPKVAGVSRLQVTAGMDYNDWEFEAGLLSSASATAIVLRFVADIADVTAMEPMFCEALAARMAMAMAEPLTQNSAKYQEAAGAYNRLIAEARAINAIEGGTTEQEGEPAQPQPAAQPQRG